MSTVKSLFFLGLLTLLLVLGVRSGQSMPASAEGRTRAEIREEKRRAEEEKRAQRRKEEEQKRQGEEEKREKEEQEKIIRKYARFTTAQLQVKHASLTQQIAGGYAGQGIGLLIAKGSWEGKVKERDEIAMEIVRRLETDQTEQANSPAGTVPRGSGTGFAITDDGYIVTNEHVVKGRQTVKVRTTQGELAAKVISCDSANDLALLKVEGQFKALPVKSSRSVRLGETIATVGFPNPELQGFSPKLTKGEISSLAGMVDDPKQFQVSLPLQPGNSGGALVDCNGNVVGVVVSKLSEQAALATTGTLAQNVNYAVKSSFLLSFLESTPGVAERIVEARTTPVPFEEVVTMIQSATVQVVTY